MSESKKLLKLMEFRYGKEFASKVNHDCQFTENDAENVKLVFLAAIVELSKFYAVKMNTLTALRAINPKIDSVAIDTSNLHAESYGLRIGESELLQIHAEIDAMRYIVEGME